MEKNAGNGGNNQGFVEISDTQSEKVTGGVTYRCACGATYVMNYGEGVRCTCGRRVGSSGFKRMERPIP